MARKNTVDPDMRHYEVQNALNCLQQAEQIKKNTSLMRDVRKATSDLTKIVGNSKTPTKKKK